MKNPFNECPECQSPVEFYDPAEDEKSGRYRCTKCGRDTVWSQVKAISGLDFINQIKQDAEIYKNTLKEYGAENESDLSLDKRAEFKKVAFKRIEASHS